MYCTYINKIKILNTAIIFHSTSQLIYKLKELNTNNHYPFWDLKAPFASEMHIYNLFKIIPINLYARYTFFRGR